jgi:hypothetical protein
MNSKVNSKVNSKTLIELAREAGWQYADGDDGYKPLWRFAELVRSDEREAIAQMIEDAPPLVEFAQNHKGGCLVCGFTPKLAAEVIRARGNT